MSLAQTDQNLEPIRKRWDRSYSSSCSTAQCLTQQIKCPVHQTKASYCHWTFTWKSSPLAADVRWLCPRKLLECHHISRVAFSITLYSISRVQLMAYVDQKIIRHIFCTDHRTLLRKSVPTVMCGHLKQA